ncbi:Zinc finger C2H2 superfamily [Sergentomyia squamirostris]
MTVNLSQYNAKQRIFLVKNFYLESGNQESVKENYENEFDQPPFSPNALDDVLTLFENTGSVFRYPVKPFRRANNKVKKPTINSLQKCEACGKSFMFLSNLKKHILVSHDIDGIYKCDICSKDCGSRQKFLGHMQFHENSRQPGRIRAKRLMLKQCEECGKMVSPPDYDQHISSHNVEFSLNCDICDKSFNWICGYKLHMMRHRDADTADITKFWLECAVCHMKVAGRKLLKIHTLKNHFQSFQDYEGLLYDNPDTEIKGENAKGGDQENTGIQFDADLPDLPQDDAMEVTENEAQKESQNAPFEFNWDEDDDPDWFEKFFQEDPNEQQSFPLSEETENNPNALNHQCDVCGKMFRALSGLRTHLTIHTNVCPYKCSVEGCLDVFKTRRILIYHEKSAHGINRYKCDLCDFEAAFHYLIRHHIRDCHNDVAFECSTCNRIFIKEADYVTHRKMIHSIYTDDDPHGGRMNRNGDTSRTNPAPKTRGKSTICFICNKLITFKQNLKRHMKSHEKSEEAFMCPEEGCSRSFPNKKLLDLHKIRHTDRRFNCAHCEKQYKDRKQLVLHIKKKHLMEKPTFRCHLCDYMNWHKEYYKRHMERKHQIQI